MIRYWLPTILLLTTLAACEAPEPETSSPEPAESTSAPPSVDLDEVIDDYVAMDRRQDEEGGNLADMSAETFLGDIAKKEAMLERAKAVQTEGLGTSADIDRRLLIGLLESDIHTANARRIWENDAARYVPTRAVIGALEAWAAAASSANAESLNAVLTALPERLAQARANLGTPPRRYTESAIFQTQSLLQQLQGAEGPDDGETLAGATEALENYLSFLRDDVLPRSTGGWALGKPAYDYILQRRWFMQDDADSILERGRSAFAETEALAAEVAERIAPGKDWITVYESLKDEHPEADAIKAAYQTQMDAAQRFVVENRLVTLPEGERVITVDTPPAMRRLSPFGTFDGVGPFEDSLTGRLVLTPVEDWLSPEQRAQRLRSHHDAWIPIIAVHEAYPGHHVHALKIKENPRPLRKVVRESIFSEGWGLYTEELMFDLGFLQGDDVRLTQLRNRLWRAARVMLDSQLHTGKITFEEAVDFLVEKVRFERYAAELEVGMYLLRPTYVLGYLIGMQEISALHRDYTERYGEPNPPSEFFDRLLSAGSIPPALVREELFADSD